MDFIEKYIETARDDQKVYICVAVVFLLFQHAVILFGEKEALDEMKPKLTGETAMKAATTAYLLCTFRNTPAALFGTFFVTALLIPAYRWRVKRDERRAKRVKNVEEKYGEPKNAVQRVKKKRAMRIANSFFA